MAYSASPLANTALKQVGGYDSPQFQNRIAFSGQIGVPAVAVDANGLYVLAIAPANGAFYSATYTVGKAGSVAAGTLKTYLISANNGANVSQNVQLGNTVTIGTNAAGNVQSTGPFTYNVLANGANSGTNTSASGGFTCNQGDVIVAVSTCNTALIGYSVDFQYSLVSAAITA